MYDYIASKAKKNRTVNCGQYVVKNQAGATEIRKNGKLVYLVVDFA